jgi:RNA polymerase sigma factor (sigma-70 family)
LSAEQEIESLFSRIREESGSIIRAVVAQFVDETERSDVESTIYLSIWTALPRYEGRSSVRNFIYPIIRRRISDYYRKRYRERALIDAIKESSRIGSMPDEEIAEKIIAATPQEMIILSLIARGLSNDELAAELALSKHTVRSHLKRLYKVTKCADRMKLMIFAIRFFDLYREGIQ